MIIAYMTQMHVHLMGTTYVSEQQGWPRVALAASS